METNSKKHLCFFCGEEAENEEWIGDKRLWCCGCSDGMKELIEISKDEESIARDRAERDNFSRYR